VYTVLSVVLISFIYGGVTAINGRHSLWKKTEIWDNLTQDINNNTQLKILSLAISNTFCFCITLVYWHLLMAVQNCNLHCWGHTPVSFLAPLHARLVNSHRLWLADLETRLSALRTETGYTQLFNKKKGSSRNMYQVYKRSVIALH
jgi:hypothetical protein